MALPEENNPKLAVAAAGAEPGLRAKAAELAEELRLPMAEPDAAGFDLLLVVTPTRLELRQPGAKAGPIFCDFIGGPLGYRLRSGGLRGELLVKAVGYKGEPLRVIDATAGLGRDAALLAVVGCAVTALERAPAMAALLEDGLRRAATDPRIGPALTSRLRVVRADAKAYLASLTGEAAPEVVYLDPMFPERTKSALVRKEMRLTRLVTGDDPDAAELLAIARQVARRRVVVKRPPLAPPLAGQAPDLQRRGKAVRYDIYLRP